MKVILFICTRQEAFCIFKFFSLSGTLLCLVRYIFWEKDDFFFMKYFKLVHAPTWKIPHYMTGFLSICTRHEAISLFHCFALSATLLCLVRYIFLEKYDFFNEMFQVGACPNLKDSLISICTRHDASGFFDCFALSATLLCLVRYIGFEKEIFQEFCCCIVVLRPQ